MSNLPLNYPFLMLCAKRLEVLCVPLTCSVGLRAKQPPAALRSSPLASALTSSVGGRAKQGIAHLFCLAFLWCFSFSALAEKVVTPPQPNALEKFFPFIILGVLFYFLFLRPQQKRRKQQESFLSQLKRGDEVLTAGGIYGKITGLSTNFVTLEVGKDVQIRALRSQISPYVVPEQQSKKDNKEKPYKKN